MLTKYISQSRNAEPMWAEHVQGLQSSAGWAQIVRMPAPIAAATPRMDCCSWTFGGESFPLLLANLSIAEVASWT